MPVATALREVDALRAWAAGALAYSKVPEHREVQAEPLPRNAMGKVLKHALSD